MLERQQKKDDRLFCLKCVRDTWYLLGTTGGYFRLLNKYYKVL